MAAPTREDTWLVTVTVGDRALGVFDGFSGGEIDSEEALYSPGGMAAEISPRRPAHDRQRDRQPLLRPGARLAADQVARRRRSASARCSIGYTPLDPSGARGGDPLTYSGTLKTVTPPEHDSTGNDAAQIELEFTCDGVA